MAAEEQDARREPGAAAGCCSAADGVPGQVPGPGLTPAPFCVLVRLTPRMLRGGYLLLQRSFAADGGLADGGATGLTNPAPLPLSIPLAVSAATTNAHGAGGTSSGSSLALQATLRCSAVRRKSVAVAEQAQQRLGGEDAVPAALSPSALQPSPSLPPPTSNAAGGPAVGGGGAAAAICKLYGLGGWMAARGVREGSVARLLLQPPGDFTLDVVQLTGLPVGPAAAAARAAGGAGVALEGAGGGKTARCAGGDRPLPGPSLPAQPAAPPAVHAPSSPPPAASPPPTLVREAAGTETQALPVPQAAAEYRFTCMHDAVNCRRIEVPAATAAELVGASVLASVKPKEYAPLAIWDAEERRLPDTRVVMYKGTRQGPRWRILGLGAWMGATAVRLGDCIVLRRRAGGDGFSIHLQRSQLQGGDSGAGATQEEAEEAEEAQLAAAQAVPPEETSEGAAAAGPDAAGAEGAAVLAPRKRRKTAPAAAAPAAEAAVGTPSSDAGGNLELCGAGAEARAEGPRKDPLPASGSPQQPRCGGLAGSAQEQQEQRQEPSPLVGKRPRQEEESEEQQEPKKQALLQGGKQAGAEEATASGRRVSPRLRHSSAAALQVAALSGCSDGSHAAPATLQPDSSPEPRADDEARRLDGGDLAPATQQPAPAPSAEPPPVHPPAPAPPTKPPPAQQQCKFQQAEDAARLLSAVGSGDLAAVHALLLSGAAVNPGKEAYTTPLLHACENGQTKVVEALLRAGANVNYAPKTGTTALHAAANDNSERGSLELLCHLLRAGANVQRRKKKGGQTPLHAAARNTRPHALGMVTALMQAGADPHAVGSARRGTVQQGGLTPLHSAAQNTSGQSAAMMQALLQAGADMDAAMEGGETALHAVARRADAEAVRVLLAAGANKEAATKTGATALHVACGQGHCCQVRALLAAGANVQATDQGGATPLHLAALRGRADMVTALLRSGTIIDAVTKGSETPLHFAVKQGHLEAVRSLLGAGARVDAVKQAGATPLHLAAQQGHPAVVRAVVAALRKGKMKVNATTWNGATALHWAAEHGSVAAAQLLLEAFAFLPAQEGKDAKMEHGWTALHLAAHRGHRDVVCALLVAGADRTARISQPSPHAGKTPLDLAEKPAVRALLQDR